MTTRPELILSLNALSMTDWCSEEELIESLQDRAPEVADRALFQRVIDYAVVAGVLARTGTLISRRRLATEALARGFEAATQDLTPGRTAPMDQRIPELDRRLRTVELRVQELQALATPGSIRWLQLYPSMMPRPVSDHLRARAAKVLGKDVTEEATVAQMTLVATQILLQGLQAENISQL